MKGILKETFDGLLRFLSVKLNRRLVYLALIIFIAFLDWLAGGQSRRTFVFYTALDGKAVVEDRMFRRSGSPETDMRRYVEDALLGPVFTDSMPLFPPETRLESFLFRKGVVYAAFSGLEELPWEEDSIFQGFLTLGRGIRRNFVPVKDVKFFINGREIFLGEFSRFFALSADNSIKPVKRH